MQKSTGLGTRPAIIPIPPLIITTLLPGMPPVTRIPVLIKYTTHDSFYNYLTKTFFNDRFPATKNLLSTGPFPTTTILANRH